MIPNAVPHVSVGIALAEKKVAQFLADETEPMFVHPAFPPIAFVMVSHPNGDRLPTFTALVRLFRLPEAYVDGLHAAVAIFHIDAGAVIPHR
jgi:hypothetical protein